MKNIRTNRRRRMKLKNFIACVTALSVVMGSSYFALADDDTVCGMKKHKHTEKCYALELACGEVEVPDKEAGSICGLVEHTHTDGLTTDDPAGCYEMKNKECDLPEVTAEEAHTHGSIGACNYVWGCDKTENTHEHTTNRADGTCYTLDCPKADDETHTSHANSCYKLTCEERHVHAEEGCAQYCNKEEKVEHAHDYNEGGCSGLVKVLGCEHKDQKSHTHQDSCYPIKTGLIEGTEDQYYHEHKDGLITDEPAGCYKEVLTCGLEEHTHDDSCYGPNEATQALIEQIEAMEIGDDTADARAKYDALTPAVQQKFVDLKKLDDLDAANPVYTEINDIPTYADATSDETKAEKADEYAAYYADVLSAVNTAKTHYEALTNAQQSYLTSQYDKLAEYAANEDSISDVVQSDVNAEKVEAMIEALKSGWTKDDVEEAREAYDDLADPANPDGTPAAPSAAQQQVSNLDYLEQCEDEIVAVEGDDENPGLDAEIEALADEINAKLKELEKTETDAVLAATNYLSTKSQDIQDLKDRYDRLSSSAKKLVTNDDELADLVEKASASAEANGHQDTPNNLRVIPTITKAESGITFKMFDYQPNINLKYGAKLPDNTTDYKTAKEWDRSFRRAAEFFNFRGATATWIEAEGETAAHWNGSTLTGPSITINAEFDQDGFTKKHATVERTLDANGYPVLDFTRYANGDLRNTTQITLPDLSDNEKSLAYLFGGTDHEGYGSTAVTAYEATNTPLTKDDDGFYSYDSRYNAVDFYNNQFMLRDYVERSKSTTNYTFDNSKEFYYDFLPFTYWDGVTKETNYDLTTTQKKNDDGTPMVDANNNPVYEESKGYGKEYTYKYNNNYWYGMTMEAEFFQTEGGKVNGQDMVFNFSGDDDVWVFIDDVLVLDLGGTHGVVTGSIDFATGKVKQYLDWAGADEDDTATSFPTTIYNCFNAAGKAGDYEWVDVEVTDDDGNTTTEKIFKGNTKHTIKMFYMERGSGSANCKLNFNLPTLPAESLTVGKELEATDAIIKDFLQGEMTYRFRVVDENGDPYIKSGTEYVILASDLTTKIGAGETERGGYFELQAGQYARFTDMLREGDEDAQYFVEELIPTTVAGQYNKVAYDINSEETTVDVKTEDGNTATYIGIKTKALDADETQTVIFTNKVDSEELSELRITKEISEDSLFDEDEEFTVNVKLGDVKVPVDTVYKVNNTEKVVKTAGEILLKAGETAVIEGILSGTTYEVKEDTGDYTTTYTGTVATVEKDADGKTVMVQDVDSEGTPAVDDAGNPVMKKKVNVVDSVYTDKATGTFPLESVVTVNIKNVSDAFEVQIPVYKSASSVPAGEAYTFAFTAVETDAQGVEKSDAKKYNTEITVDNTTGTAAATLVGTNAIVIAYDMDDIPDEPVTYYYKVTETLGTEDEQKVFIFDTRSYIVAVTVDKGADPRAVITSVNGAAPTVDSDGNVDPLVFTNTRPGGGGGGGGDDMTVRVKKVWSGIDQKDWFKVKVALKEKDGDYLRDNDGEMIIKELSAENGWNSEWVDLDDDKQWEVVELNVPEGVTVTVDGKWSSDQTITNSKTSSTTPEEPTPTTPPSGGGGNGGGSEDDGLVLGDEDAVAPKVEEEDGMVAGVAETGDNNHLMAAVAAMAAALAGIVLLKKKKEN